MLPVPRKAAFQTQDAKGHAVCILMDFSGYRTGFAILSTMDLFGHIIHCPGGLSSALQVLISILYLYSLPTPWLPFPSGQSKMAQHIASSPLGGRNHFWLRTNEFEAFIILENRTCSGMQWFYYFSMLIIFQLCDLV